MRNGDIGRDVGPFGFNGSGTVRYRGLKQAGHRQIDIFCGEVGELAVTAGSLISIRNMDGSPRLLLTAMTDESSRFSAFPFDIPEAKTVSLEVAEFDRRKLQEIATARGSTLEDGEAIEIFDDNSTAGEDFICRVKCNARLYVIAPVIREFLSMGGGSHFRVEIRDSASANADQLLPDPLGRVCDEWRIETGTAKAYELKKGQFVQIIDVEGQQCSDFMAMRADALRDGMERYIDSTSIAHNESQRLSVARIA